jgi:hypothetical protein
MVRKTNDEFPNPNDERIPNDETPRLAGAILRAFVIRDLSFFRH